MRVSERGISFSLSDASDACFQLLLSVNLIMLLLLFLRFPPQLKIPVRSVREFYSFLSPQLKTSVRDVRDLSYSSPPLIIDGKWFWFAPFTPGPCSNQTEDLFSMLPVTWMSCTTKSPIWIDHQMNSLAVSPVPGSGWATSYALPIACLLHHLQFLKVNCQSHSPPL